MFFFNLVEHKVRLFKKNKTKQKKTKKKKKTKQKKTQKKTKKQQQQQKNKKKKKKKKQKKKTKKKQQEFLTLLHLRSFRQFQNLSRGNMEPCLWKFDRIRLRGISKQQK